MLIQMPRETRVAIIEEIEEGSSPFLRYWVMVALSTTIAAYGLLSNSAAVIIGAMLVAPLMGPIFGISLGLVMGHNLLLRKALVAEVLGVALAIGIGWAVGVLPLNLGVSQEMLGRTAPTLYDLLIALASGLAGAYATVNVKISSALPGVAISVALVPPLATCGLFLARGDTAHGFGAFLLFAANLFAIHLAASGMFFIHDLGSQRELRKLGLGRFVLKFLPSLIALGIMGVFLTKTLTQIATSRQVQATVSSVLSEEIGLRTGGNLERVLDLLPQGDGYRIVAVALTPQPFDPAQVKSIEASLEKALGKPVDLVMRSLISKDADRAGQVYHTEAEREASFRVSEEQKLLQQATQAVRKGLADVAGANLESLSRSDGEGTPTLTAVVRTPTAIAPDQVATLQQDVAGAVGREVRLLVRSVLTRDADSQRFIYDPEPEKAPELTPAEVALRQRVTSVIQRRLGVLPGAAIVEIKVNGGPQTVDVEVTVEAPEPVRPEAVAPIQSDLVRFVDPRLRLTVRTHVVGVATAGGWVDSSPDQ